jgi:protein arginine N-methyltransferase 2|tara:strand:- start:16 stop:690 length:675 start_codon:yes stop_codon:yes gene_type:complete
MLPYTPTPELNIKFLETPLEYNDNGDLRAQQDHDYVMMEWERPMMLDISRYLCEGKEDVKILNVGFGMGIIDTYIQNYNPLEHWIIEGHPDVCKRMVVDGWDIRKGVKCLFSRWQDVYQELPEDHFDAIYFDTYNDHEQHLFADRALKLVKKGGKLSFFNDLFTGSVADNASTDDVEAYYVDWLPDNFKMSIENTYIKKVPEHSNYSPGLTDNYYLHIILERLY